MNYPYFNQPSPWNWRTCIFLLVGCLLMLAIFAPMCLGAEETHFTLQEFACHHCGKIKVDFGLLRKLEILRSALGDKPIIITSGYRCPKHNREVGGVSNSQHLFGRAADIKVKGKSPHEIARTARACGFSFVKEYRSWVHVDVR